MFYIFEIAQKLAREPGRLEFDRDEAYRIGGDMYDWYRRGEFGEREVVAQYGDPPSFGPIGRAEEEARRRGQEWQDLDFGLWYGAIGLTYPAAKRYVEGCGLAGAARVLRDWFSDADQSRGKRPTDAELDEWMKRNVKPGAKRDPTIADCREATGATVRAAAAARRRLPDKILLRPGQKRLPPEIDH